MDDLKTKDKVLSTFETVARAYDKVEFFKISADNIKEMSSLKKGDTYLDVACGTGNVVLNIAESFCDVSCTGLDISQAMLTVAQNKTEIKALKNVSFMCQDLENIDTTHKYNLITCSYALFFLPNPIDALKRLMSLLEDKGELIFTSFTKKAFSPAKDILLDELQNFNICFEDKKEPWKDLSTEEEIKLLCKKAGIKELIIQTKEIRYPLTIEKWWELKMSTGYRGMIDQLNEKDFKVVKHKYLQSLRIHANIQDEVELIADTFYTRITKL